jgi:hypothetical protein
LSIPKHLFSLPRFTSADYGHVWMQIKGYVNQLCADTPIDLRMGIQALIINTKVATLRVTLAETQRKATINALTNLDKTHVNWRAGWKYNLNISSCWASTRARTMRLYV